MNTKSVSVMLLITISFLFLLLFSYLSFAADQEKNTDPNAIGQVVWVKGTVKAVGANKATRTLQRRSAIYAKDTVMTDSTSTGEIVFTDNSVMSVRPDTTFKIDQYQFGKNVPAGQSKFAANIVKGGFRTITGLIPKDNPDNYQVNTPVATISVRGTAYAVFYKGQLWIEYTQGEPCVGNLQGKVCLNKTNPYANVTTGTAAPVIMQKIPDVFTAQPPVTKTTFSPSATIPAASNAATPANPTGTGTNVTPSETGGTSKVPSKTVGGFCIS